MKKTLLALCLLIYTTAFSQGGYTPFPKLRITTVPVENNATKQVLVRDSSTGNVNYVNKDSLGSGGAYGDLESVLANGNTATSNGATTTLNGSVDFAPGSGFFLPGSEIKAVGSVPELGVPTIQTNFLNITPFSNSLVSSEDSLISSITSSAYRGIQMISADLDEFREHKNKGLLTITREYSALSQASIGVNSIIEMNGNGIAIMSGSDSPPEQNIDVKALYFDSNRIMLSIDSPISASPSDLEMTPDLISLYSDEIVLNNITNSNNIRINSAGAYYNSKELSTISNYSTTETVLNEKWINGKPIYRKTIILTTADAVASPPKIELATKFINLQTVVDFKIISDFTTNSGTVSYGNYDQGTDIMYSIVNQDLVAAFRSDISPDEPNLTLMDSITLTLEFTKTID